MNIKNLSRPTVITLLLSGLLHSLPAISFGQTADHNDTNHWRIGIGYQNHRTLDQNISPLIYVSNNAVLNAQFEKYKTSTLWNLGMNLAIGSNQSKRHGRREAITYDPYPLLDERDSTIYEINPGLSLIQAELRYAMLWKLRSEKRPWYLGASLSDRFTYSAMGADVWFFNQMSLMAAARTTLYCQRKSTVDIGVQVPIMSYLLRQPYALDPSLPEASYFKAYLQTGSSFSSINKFQQINIGVDYRYRLNRGKSIGLLWQMTWMNFANIPDRNLQSYAHSFFITYTL